mmetsp:Transcript_20661/g.45311  ORF Transcript_20661/g.45311 Transcript_20661/m.45311 type:complete len:231 (+) Transcript_20661:1161-1853(+)
MFVGKIQDLRGHICRSSKHCVAFVDDEARETHIADLRPAILIEENVPWFDVSVGNVTIVHVLQAQRDAADVEANVCSRKSLRVPIHHGLQRAAEHCLHEHVDIAPILVTAVEADDEVAAHEGKQVPLVADLTLKSHLADEALGGAFQGIAIFYTIPRRREAGVLLQQRHLGKVPAAQYADRHKRIGVDCVLPAQPGATAPGGTLHFNVDAAASLRHDIRLVVFLNTALRV